MQSITASPMCPELGGPGPASGWWSARFVHVEQVRASGRRLRPGACKVDDCDLYHCSRCGGCLPYHGSDAVCDGCDY